MNKITGNRVAEKLSERERLLKNYNNARSNLLLVIILTIVNIVLVVSGTNTYFLFSAIIPFVMGTALSGIVYFDSDLQAFITENNILPGTEEYEYYMSAEYAASEKLFYSVLVADAVIILAIYFISWLCSKKPEKKGFLVSALVLFVLDTAVVVLLREISVNSIMDIIFHIYVLVYLIMGVSAASKLKKLPPEEPSKDFDDVDVLGPYEATPVGEEIDPGFTYYENTTSTLNGESVDGK